MQLNKIRGIRHSGASLVELMIGITIGMMVVASALTIYATSGYGASTTLGAAKLNMELRGTMDVIVDDVRRAGFGRDGDTLTYMSPDNDLAVYDTDSDGVNDCLVYSYQPPSGGAMTFGFRVSANEVDMRNSTIALTGAAADCTTDYAWEDLTDVNTLIVDAPADGGDYFDISYRCLRANEPTTATFAVASPASQPCATGNTLYTEAAAQATASNTPIALVEIRYVTVQLEGHLARDPSMRMALAQSVMVRNHRLDRLNP